MVKVIRLSDPAVEPITIGEAKEHLRITADDDLTYVASLVIAARQHVENYCGRPFAPATFAVIYDGDLPSGDAAVSVPVADVTSVTAVKYRDDSGAIQTWAAENYRQDADRQTLTPVSAWPAGTDLRIEVAAGADAPEAIKAAMKLVIGDLYDLRTANVAGMTVVANPAAESLMTLYRERMGI